MEKVCEQCQQQKTLSAFHQRKNKTDGRMRICATCYLTNLQESRRKTEEQLQQREQKRQRLQEDQSHQRAQEQQEEVQRREEERMARYHQLPDRQCRACKQVLPATSFDFSQFKQIDDQWVPLLYQRCKSCHAALRERQAIPCCLCGRKTLAHHFMSRFQGFRLDGGGDRIYLCCRDCESAFLGLSEGSQRAYIHSRCHLTFPQGQSIYGLFEPESESILRYVGRTHQLQRRYREHLKDCYPDQVTWGAEYKIYYTRGNWVYDLQRKGLRPLLKELKLVEVAPSIIEWEYRHIYHAIQSGCKLLNHEYLSDTLIQKVKQAPVHFLSDSFEDLVKCDIFSSSGIEAFIHAWYQ